MLDDAALLAMASDLARIRGVVGVTLGGSRARGTATNDSDADLGVYLRGDVDDAAIAALADAWSDASERDRPHWTPSGGWGPWVDGGAWLVVDGTRVDWIRRDLDRVDAQWLRAERGELAFHAQPGHPLGFLDVAYCGELALARVLVDPTGALAERKKRMRRMPAPLGAALASRLWEAEFTLAGAAKAATRGDAAYVALCVAHATLLAAHAIHGRDRAWATNEKGLVAAAAKLPHAPEGFATDVAAALTLARASAPELVQSVERARAVIVAVERSIASGLSTRG